MSTRTPWRSPAGARASAAAFALWAALVIADDPAPEAQGQKSSDPVSTSELLDLTGRRVWSEDQGVRGAGQWSASLPRGAGAGRLAAGLDFVRFEVNGRVAAVNKVTLLE